MNGTEMEVDAAVHVDFVLPKIEDRSWPKQGLVCAADTTRRRAVNA
jgi:hypothetical protein